MNFKKLLVAYDGSPGSEKAVAWAVELACKLGSEVVVASVVRPPEFGVSVDEVDEFYADGEKHYRPLLDKVAEYGRERGLTLQTVLLHGHPAESIVRFAADRQVDLIVMGTRGMGGFKSLIIGSVAQKVVAYANVPVTIIK